MNKKLPPDYLIYDPKEEELVEQIKSIYPYALEISVNKLL